MVDLKASPFFLDETQVRWVEDTLASLSVEEKIGQMFCPIGGDTGEDFLAAFVEEFKPGAMLYRPMPAAQIRKKVTEAVTARQEFPARDTDLPNSAENGRGGADLRGISPFPPPA